MNTAFAIAAACVALAWLVAEQGLARCKALHQPLEELARRPRTGGRAVTLPFNKTGPAARRLAKLLIGALLLGTMTGAFFMSLAGGENPALAALTGCLLATCASAALLHHRHRIALPAVMPWLLAVLAPLFVALACIAQDAQSWLLGGFALALALGLGIPAFSALAQRLDEADVPTFMRPLPARALAASIVALAMAGSLSW